MCFTTCSIRRADRDGDYLPEVADPLCGLVEADPLFPELFTELFPAVADPVEPVLPDWVLPLVLALPDFAADPEFDEVLTAPDWPPSPELPEVATGLEVALPVSVEPVEPVLPEVAAALPLQVPVIVTQGATVTAGPELPELPEFPEFPDCADPVEVAGPVFPESASPELAVVWLELVEFASPVVPPVVVPLAVELPLWPEVPVAVEPSLACPVFPELAAPLAFPEVAEPFPEPAFPLPQLLPESPCGVVLAGPLFGVDVAGPLFPEPFCEAFAALADPVDPVSPDWVFPWVLALPDLATEPEFDEVSTGPDRPPLPESPEVATGSEVARPVSVEPVEPVDPDEAFWLPWPEEPLPQGLWFQLGPWPQLTSGFHPEPRGLPPKLGANTSAPPDFPDLPEFPESPDCAHPLELAAPVRPEFAFPELAVVWFELPAVALPVDPPVVWPVAELSPLPPDVEVAVEPSLALPVRPDLAVPSALPDLAVWVTCPVLVGCHVVDPAPAVPTVKRSDPPTRADAQSVFLNGFFMMR
jgi:hypothetical protein